MEPSQSIASDLLGDELLKSLCCPETRQNLAPADPDLVARLNKSIAAGTLKNRGGRTVTQPIDDGFIRADGQWIYPIRNKIPILLIDEAVSTSG